MHSLKLWEGQIWCRLQKRKQYWNRFFTYLSQNISHRPPLLDSVKISPAGARQLPPNVKAYPFVPYPSSSTLASSQSSLKPPSKMIGRVLFPPRRSPDRKSTLTPTLPSKPPPPPLFHMRGQQQKIPHPPFSRPMQHSGPHHIPPSINIGGNFNMGGPFCSPSPFSTTPSPLSQFFWPPPVNVHPLLPSILQNMNNCLNFFFASVLTTILVHPSPYGSNSYT